MSAHSTYTKQSRPRAYFGHISALSALKIARELQATPPGTTAHQKARRAMARRWGVPQAVIGRIVMHYAMVEGKKRRGDLYFFSPSVITYFEPSMEH